MLYMIYTAIVIIAGAVLLLVLMRHKSIRQGERVAREMVENDGKQTAKAETRPQPGERPAPEPSDPSGATWPMPPTMPPSSAPLSPAPLVPTPPVDQSPEDAKEEEMKKKRGE